VRLRGESGQALVLVIGAMAALVVGALILGAIGQALGARGHEQRAADLAAISAARAMRDACSSLPACATGCRTRATSRKPDTWQSRAPPLSMAPGAMAPRLTPRESRSRTRVRSRQCAYALH